MDPKKTNDGRLKGSTKTEIAWCVDSHPIEITVNMKFKKIISIEK